MTVKPDEPPKFDAFIAYRRRDGKPIARWIKSTLERFMLTEELLRAIPADKRDMHARRPDIFIDTSIDRPAADWLRDKIYPALDGSERLVVVSTPLAFAPVEKADGASEPNWVQRETARFIDGHGDVSRDRITVVVGPGAPLKDFPEPLAGHPYEAVDLRRFSLFGSKLRAATGLIAVFYGIPDTLLPKLRREQRRQRRDAVAGYCLLGLLAGAMAAAISAMIYDRTTNSRKLDVALSETERLAGGEAYHDALKIAFDAIPRKGDWPWRADWSDPRVRMLAVTMAGAAQLGPSSVIASDEEEVRSSAFSPDNLHLATGSSCGTVSVWEGPASWHRIIHDPPSPTCAHGDTVGWIRDLHFTSDGSAVVEAGAFGVRYLPLTGRSGKEITFARLHKDVRTVNFSRDEREVVTASDDDTVQIWPLGGTKARCEVKLPPAALPAGYRYATGASFSPDGVKVLVARRDGLIALVDAASCEILDVGRDILQTRGPSVWSVGFDATGRRVVSSSSDGEIAIWDVATKARITLPRQMRSVAEASFSRDGRMMLSGTADGNVQLWDLATLKRVANLRGHAGPILSASLSADGRHAVTTADDKTIRIWDLGGGVVPDAVRGFEFPIKAAAFSRDGTVLAVGCVDGTVRTFAVGGDGHLTPGQETRSEIGPITALAFGKDDGDVLIATEFGRSARWKVGAGIPELLRTMGDPAVVAGSVEGGIATASASKAGDGEIRDASSHDGRHLVDASAFNGLEYSRDGSELLGVARTKSTTGLQNAVIIWDPRTGAVVMERDVPATLLSAHFSEDGRFVALGATDHLARVLDRRKANVQTFSGHGYDVNSARLSPGGDRLVTASGDRSVRVWDVATGRLALRHEIGAEVLDAFFTTDGNHIVVATDDSLLTYDVSLTAHVDAMTPERVCQSLVQAGVSGLCTLHPPGRR